MLPSLLLGRGGSTVDLQLVDPAKARRPEVLIHSTKGQARIEQVFRLEKNSSDGGRKLLSVAMVDGNG